MVHPEIKRLLEEVFGSLHEKDRERAGEYPEVYLVSLLKHIKEDLPVVSSTLDFTVDRAGFGDNTEKFKRMLAMVHPAEKTRRHKAAKKPFKHQRQAKAAA